MDRFVDETEHGHGAVSRQLCNSSPIPRPATYVFAQTILIKRAPPAASLHLLARKPTPRERPGCDLQTHALHIRARTRRNPSSKIAFATWSVHTIRHPEHVGSGPPPAGPTLHGDPS